jgi:uncharacterized phiE125 gp8 family phage protein
MIDTARAKAYLKVEHSVDDTLIGGLVSAAVSTIEAQIGKFLSSKPFTQTLAGFPCRAPYEIRLNRGPVSEVSAIEYDPSDGTAAIELTEFRLVEGERARLLPAFGEVWPATLDGSGTVRISGVAGYSDGEAPDLDQAALMLVAHWYENREAVSATAANEVPLGVKMLLQPHRPAGLA